MSHFYGTLQGNRGEKTCGGSKDSGLKTYTASWEGAIRVFTYHSKSTDKDMVEIRMVPWQGQGVEVLLYDGPVGEYAPIAGKCLDQTKKEDTASGWPFNHTNPNGSM